MAMEQRFSSRKTDHGPGWPRHDKPQAEFGKPIAGQLPGNLFIVEREGVLLHAAKSRAPLLPRCWSITEPALNIAADESDKNMPLPHPRTFALNRGKYFFNRSRFHSPNNTKEDREIQGFDLLWIKRKSDAVRGASNSDNSLKHRMFFSPLFLDKMRQKG
jgi:hypothetical protein